MSAIKGAVIAVALVAASGPGPVAAETGVIRPHGYPADIALAGDQVVWTEPDGPSVEVWAGAPGRAPELVDRVEFQPGCDGYLRPALAVSPSLSLLSTLAYSDRCDGLGTRAAFSQHHLGSIDGPLDRIARCEADRDGDDVFNFAGLRPADVWQQAYAYWQCDDEGGHVEVRDTAAEPLSPARAVGDGGFAPRIAGRFVAWFDNPVSGPDCAGPDIVVYDRVADAEVYRLSRCDVFGVRAFDVQEDGKLAFASGSGSAGHMVVGWASPDEPHVHRLSLEPRALYDVRISGDRIAFQRGGRFERGAAPGHEPRAEVGLARLDGSFRIISRGTDAFAYEESFDYDGDRVVWREFGCEKRRLVIRGAAATGVAPGGATRCRLRLRRPPDVRRRAVIFRFGCGAFQPPCDFVARLRIIGHGGGPAGQTAYGDNPVRVKFTRRARRLLRREGSLRVRAKVELRDGLGRIQTRSARIRLRRP